MDQLTIEDLRVLPTALIGPMARIGEKVAAIEGRFGAEIAALKEDTTKIGQAIQNIANTQQGSIRAELRCEERLDSIGEKLTAHSNQVLQNVAFQKESMTELKKQLNTIGSKVELLMSTRHWVQGSWWALTKVTAIIAGLLALAWNTLQHLKLLS